MRSMSRFRGAGSSLTQMRSNRPLLFVVCLAQFMVILDVSVVNVALPAMRTDLHFSTSGLQWVVNAYTITFAGFMMLGARSADLLGRRRVFVTGTLLFTAGLVSLTYGIVRTDVLGWGALGVDVPLALAAVLLGAFLYVEGRVSQAPLVPLSIFRRGQLRSANLVVILMYAALF